MANRKPSERQVNLGFSRDDDIRLYEFLKKRSYAARYPLPTFIILSLHDAFRELMDNEEVDAVAEEALAKVRERKAAPPKEDFERDLHEHGKAIPEPPPTPTAKPAMTPDDAYEQALKQVQQLNAEPMKPKKAKEKK